jgi:spermidine synthase
MKLAPNSRAAGLALLVASVILATQVLVHRLVSAKLLNNYAFLVISLTMLGFAVSGVVLTRFLDAFLAQLNEAFTSLAAMFVVTLLLASHFFCSSAAGASSALNRPGFVIGLMRWLPLALLFAVPFSFAGLILSALLAAPAFQTRRIYFFDLVGSALGALLVVPMIANLGVESSLLIVCAVMLGSTLVLAPPRGRLARALALVAVAGILGGVIFPRWVFEMYYPDGSVLANARIPGSQYFVEHIAWDPVARIEVSRIPPPSPDRIDFPSLIGGNQSFHQRFRRMLTQNNYAFTYAVDYDGTRSSLTGIEETIYAAAYETTSVARPTVLTIGVGGGFDILNALYFDAAKVTGVEVNAATVGILTRTYRDYFRHWVEDPRVHIVLGEGRHFLATSSDSYDVIQLSGVDSYSGTAAAAHVFSENYLYTAEAFDLYLKHLTPQGILCMMRLEFRPPREMLRALTTAVAALRRAGAVRPADHIAMVTARNQIFTALLVKQTPFTNEETARLRSWTEKSPYFGVSFLPTDQGPAENHYQLFLDQGSPEREKIFVASYPYDISPADDNRPFFFNYAFWWHIFPASPTIWGSVPVMEYSVLLLFGIIAVVSLVCVLVPLRSLTRRGAEVEGRWRLVAYFAATGVGYLAIEVALLQEFGLFLGHPNYSLSVVLASLLFTTGLGSLLSAKITSRLGGVRFVSYALAAVVLALYAFGLPRLPGLLDLPFGARVAVVFGLVAPMGLLLGVFVPSALDRLKIVAPAFIPWAWGINGIFSVMAPILAIAFSMTWGIRALLLSAVPLYLIAGWTFPVVAPTSAIGDSSRS